MSGSRKTPPGGGEDAKIKIVRNYHDNGVLADEIPLRGDLEHGTVRHWNSAGELLGSYEMRDGTGVTKLWYQNGQLRCEIPRLNGWPHGRMRCWDEGGELITQIYHIKGKKVGAREGPG